MEAYAEMPIRKSTKPFTVEQLKQGRKIGSRLQIGAPPIVILAGDLDLYHEVDDHLHWSANGHAIYQIVRWEEHDYRTDREVVGLSVYCIHPSDAFGIQLMFNERLRTQFDQAA